MVEANMTNFLTLEKNKEFTTECFLFSISVAIIISAIIKYLWDRRWLYYYSLQVAGPTPAWPIVGNALYFKGGSKDILDNIMSLITNYKTPGRVWLGHRLFYGMEQPNDLEVILNKTLHKEQLYDFTKPIVGTGLFIAPVEKWRKSRKIIMPTFNQQILNSYVEIFVEQANILVQKLKKYEGKGIFDVYPHVSLCTLDIICETALGTKIHAQAEESDYAQLITRGMEIIFERMFHIWFHPDFIWNLHPLSKELNEITVKLRKFQEKIIEKKRQDFHNKVEFNNNRRKIFLDYLIEMTEKNDLHWTNEDLMGESQTLLIAGSDSTGSIDSFLLVLLGMYPEIQQKVYEELEEIFNGEDRDVDYSDLPRMVYMERVIKETLRLFPVGPIIVRAVHEDIKLDSCVISKGSSCVLAIICTHRDPKLWPNPLIFDPDRFLPENSIGRHPYSYLPFSAGPRNCIGGKYAMMAMKAVVATIVRHFKITSDYKKIEDIKVKADIIIKVANGWNIALESRN